MINVNRDKRNEFENNSILHPGGVNKIEFYSKNVFIYLITKTL